MSKNEEKPSRYVKKSHNKQICCECGKIVKSEKELFVYFDSANISITKSMSNKGYCQECYKKKWKY
jgi:hypothetical protein